MSEDNLTNERRKLLESLPGWDRNHPETVWNEKFSRVKKFVEKEGRFPSPCSTDSDEKKIGSWVQSQKRAKKTGKITEQRISLLESVSGWAWSRRPEGEWEKNYNALKAFLEKNERYPSSASKTPFEKTLGKWTALQRGKLT